MELIRVFFRYYMTKVTIYILIYIKCYTLTGIWKSHEGLVREDAKLDIVTQIFMLHMHSKLTATILYGTRELFLIFFFSHTCRVACVDGDYKAVRNKPRLHQSISDEHTASDECSTIRTPNK